MKRIAIFFDGTANRTDADFQTNVVLLSRCVAATGGDDRPQLVQNHQGVGTGRGSTIVAQTIDLAQGGALALGLIDIVVEAHRALVFAYAHGGEGYRPRTLQQVRTLAGAMSPEDWQGHRAARVALDGGPTHRPGAP
jgi:uncharacterized protein (DUF2235 family)